MVSIQIRFTDAQAAKLGRMSERHNLSRSEVLRRLLSAAPETGRGKQDIQDEQDKDSILSAFPS